MANDGTGHQQQRPFNTKALILRSFIEFIEPYGLDLGIKIPGVDRFYQLLRDAGVNDRWEISALSVAAQSAVDTVGIFSPTLRELLKELGDLFFDRFQIFSIDAKEPAVRGAIEQGRRDVRTRIEEIKRRNAKKSKFPQFRMELEETQRTVLDAWYGALNLQERELFEDEYRHKFESVDELKELVRIIEAHGNGLQHLRMIRGKKPGILKNLAAAARGESSPEIDHLQDMSAQRRASLDAKADLLARVTRFRRNQSR